VAGKDRGALTPAPRRATLPKGMSETRGVATFLTAAEAYDRHVGRYGAGLARALCDAAGVRAGQRALDVGCGPGSLAIELAGRLGAGSVAAVDPSGSFVEACRRRLRGGRVEQAPAEHLPFPGASFDCVLAQLSVNFMTDPLAGVREMARVTCPGGTVAAAVWDYAGEMTLLRRFWDAAVAQDPAAAEHDEGVSMSYCSPEELGGLWLDAGLEDVAVGPVVVRAGYDGFDDLWGALEAGAGPASAYAAGLPAPRRGVLREEMRRRLGVTSEAFELSARAWVVTGRAG
jgi:SAM-dependent methyltransferase